MIGRHIEVNRERKKQSADMAAIFSHALQEHNIRIRIFAARAEHLKRFRGSVKLQMSFEVGIRNLGSAY